MVVMRRTVGNAEKSSGRSIQSATIKIKIDNDNESANPKSIRTVGIGMKRMARMNTMANEKLTSVDFLLSAFGPAGEITDMSDVAGSDFVEYDRCENLKLPADEA